MAGLSVDLKEDSQKPLYQVYLEKQCRGESHLDVDSLNVKDRSLLYVFRPTSQHPAPSLHHISHMFLPYAQMGE